jgi:hypothetical protein
MIALSDVGGALAAQDYGDRDLWPLLRKTRYPDR